ncbi:MAG: TonB-dependent receptor [Cyclobacteriaceae bacterium]|nr:TonB-dependent receptor [Cyclobacteriaceae bacterium]
MKYPVLVLVFLVFLSLCTHAQDTNQRITGEFTNLKFSEFANQIERQSDYRFYFNASQLDSLIVNVRALRKPLNEILQEVFKDTEFRYSIDNNAYVYVMLRNPIITELPAHFFSRDFNTIETSDPDNTRFTEAEKVKTEKAIVIGTRGANTKATATLAGFVRYSKSGESLVGATVMVEKPLTGAITDGNGYYSITLPKGEHLLKINSLGMKSVQRSIIIHSDGRLNFDVEEEVLPLKEVIVESNRDETVMGLQMGLEKFDFKTMKQLPVALGEVDVIKTMLTLPGVQTVGEGTVGFNVRGGAADQNLILFNEATVFNPSHLFGFFSTFNPDIVKNVELYKSGVPSEYGGRISSVLDIQTREGNKRKWSGSGGISPITGRLAFEGPIIKDKLSLLVSGRSTYSDWLLSKVPSSTINKSEAAFYDLNANLNYSIDSKNSLAITAYTSHDEFKLQSDTVYSYQNHVLGLKWKHIFTNRLLGAITTNYSGYAYNIKSLANPLNAFNLDYSIRQVQAKTDFSYFITNKHTLTFGAGTLRYDLEPGNYQPVGAESIVTPDKLQSEQALESFAYVGSQFEVNPKLLLYGGIRYSLFNNFGPHDVYMYPEGSVRDVTTITDTVTFTRGKKIASYGGPEYRFSARYNYAPNQSFKLSYNRHRQYLQMLSNTTAIAPTDVWKLSDPYIKPLIGDQVSLGYYLKDGKRSIEVSIEAYYKWMQNFLDYKGGAELIQNHHIETDVLNAKGKAYGLEFMLKRTSGKLNGWLSYTYSRSLLQAEGATPVETINRGSLYPSNYDKPHAVNFISNYKFSRRFSTSVNLVYSTGRPITLPIGMYTVEGVSRLIYSERNQYRIPDYFRTDLALNIEGNHKIKKLAHSYWSISVYNLTARRNAYSVFYTSENGEIKGYKLSIFGTAIPTISYNFKF